MCSEVLRVALNVTMQIGTVLTSLDSMWDNLKKIERMKCNTFLKSHFDIIETKHQNYAALVSNSVRMKCKIGRNSVEVNLLLFQLGVLVRNSARMKCTVARDSSRSQSFVISVGRPS